MSCLYLSKWIQLNYVWCYWSVIFISWLLLSENLTKRMQHCSESFFWFQCLMGSGWATHRDTCHFTDLHNVVWCISTLWTARPFSSGANSVLAYISIVYLSAFSSQLSWNTSLFTVQFEYINSLLCVFLYSVFYHIDIASPVLWKLSSKAPTSLLNKTYTSQMQEKGDWFYYVYTQNTARLADRLTSLFKNTCHEYLNDQKCSEHFTQMRTVNQFKAKYLSVIPNALQLN